MIAFKDTMKILISFIVLSFIISGCDSSSKDEKVELGKKYFDQNQSKEIDTSNIENQIALHEYLIREKYGTWNMSEEKLQKLKDSINYDSIIRHRKYPLVN